MDYLFVISFMMVLSSVLGLIALLIRSSERTKHLAREQMNMVIQQLSNTNPNTNPTHSQPHQDPYDMPSLDLTRNELYKALNFMLMMGVITSEQYNEIEAKAFPYIKS
jgi:hypothetical protein